jgi:hypothetical protein
MTPASRITPAIDRADFAAFLADTGLTPEWVAAVSANPDDQVAMPDGYLVRVAPSPIHGLGTFSTGFVAEGAVIAPLRLAARRTPAGRFVNHSGTPNARAVPRSLLSDADVDLVALRAIAPGEELLTDYRATLRARRLVADARREHITALIADLMANGDIDGPPVKHTVADGMYMRELFIPKGMLIAGRVHRVPCLNICSSGDIEITNEHGLARVGAGFTAASAAGTQKLGYALADTVWINVFRTDLTDIAAIERAVFLSTEEMIARIDPRGQHFHDYLQLRGTP